VNVLVVECSTRSGSVALFQDDENLERWRVPAGRAVRGELFLALKDALARVGQIDRVVVGIGPGSYNGIRTAVSAAAGLAMSTGAELAPVASPLGVSREPEYFYLGDARGGLLHFTRVRAGVSVDGPRLVNPEEARKELMGAACPAFSVEPIDGLDQLQRGGPDAVLLARPGILASASEAVPEPLYLKPPHITQPKRGKFPVEKAPFSANSGA